MLANNIASNGLTAVRRCYAFVGPNQPGVNEPDPTWNPKDATKSSPSACVPDPGGFPEYPGYPNIHYYGPKTNACKLQASSSGPAADHKSAVGKPPKNTAAAATKQALKTPGKPGLKGAPPINLQQTLNSIISKVSGTVTQKLQGAAQTAASQTGGLTTNETQQLLNYLLAP